METAATAADVPEKTEPGGKQRGGQKMNSRTEAAAPLSLKIVMNDIKICVQKLDGLEPSGLICHCCLENPLPFRGMGDMILKIDRLCDRPEGGPPGRAEKRVRFYHEFREFGAMKGELFAVFLTLRYRQNVSWQGSVHFSGDAGVYQFRSVLELMGYMMEKMEELQKRGGEYAG